MNTGMSMRAYELKSTHNGRMARTNVPVECIDGRIVTLSCRTFQRISAKLCGLTRCRCQWSAGRLPAKIGRTARRIAVEID